MKQHVLLSKREMHQPVVDFLAPVTTVLRADEPIRDALHTLQGRKMDQKIFYFYVLDRDGKLVGVVSTRNLLLATLDEKIFQVMDPAVAMLDCRQNMHEALESLEKLRLLALPVVDEERRLLGMIDIQNYVEQPLKEMNTEIRRNIFQIIGLTIEEGKLGTPWKGYQARMPWIVCNIVSGLACALISKAYETVLAKVIILAMFIPLVLTLTESISMQSMTQSLSILRSPHMLFGVVKRRVLLEFKTVFLLSLTSATAIGLISYFWGGGWGTVGVIGLTLFLAITLSAMVGTIMPIILKVLEKDPKIAAGPVVLMFVDVIATTLYFSIGAFLLL